MRCPQRFSQYLMAALLALPACGIARAQGFPEGIHIDVGARLADHPFTVRLFGSRYCGSTVEFYRPQLSGNRLLVPGSWVDFAPCSSADQFDQTVLAPALPAGTYTVVSGYCDYPALDLGNCPSLVQAGLVVPPSGELRLVGGRFRVHLTFNQPDLPTLATAPAVQLSDNSGDFTFFGPANVEVTVKVLDGLLVNQRFWVFAASMTNIGFQLVVEDLAHCTGTVGGPCASKTYTQLGGTNRNFLDTEAFTQ